MAASESESGCTGSGQDMFRLLVRRGRGVDGLASGARLIDVDAADTVTANDPPIGFVEEDAELLICFLFLHVPYQ